MMQEAAWIVDNRYARDEKLKALTENIMSLNRKCNCFEEKMIKCNQGIEKSMEEIKNILFNNSKKKNNYLLLRNILSKFGEQLEERNEVEYQLKKYRYHQRRGQKRLSLLQDEIKSFPDDYVR